MSDTTSRAVANSVMNSTLPINKEDAAYAAALEQVIRRGDQANPSSGFSYLDNIAGVLNDPQLPMAGGVLLDQLLGKTGTGARVFGDKGGGQLIPTDPSPGTLRKFSGASDETDDPRTNRTYGGYNIPMPDAKESGKLRNVPLTARRRT